MKVRNNHPLLPPPMSKILADLTHLNRIGSILSIEIELDPTKYVKKELYVFCSGT